MIKIHFCLIKQKILFFFARKLIYIFPLSIFKFWFFGEKNKLEFQRIFIIKIIISLFLGLFFSFIIKLIYPRERPLSIKNKNNTDYYNTSSSFPSNHGIVVFVFIFSLLFWIKNWIIIFFLLIISIFILWSRILLKFHYSIDMVGSFFISIISCQIGKYFCNYFGNKILLLVMKLYSCMLLYLI